MIMVAYWSNLTTDDEPVLRRILNFPLSCQLPRFSIPRLAEEIALAFVT